MEGGNQSQFFAVLVFTSMDTTESGQVWILPGVTGGWCLTARIGISPGVEYHHFDRRFWDKNTWQCTETDVISRTISTHANDSR